MQELKFGQVKEVNGGFVALYWVGKGAYIAGKAAVGYAVRNKVATAGAVGVAAGLMEE